MQEECPAAIKEHEVRQITFCVVAFFSQQLIEISFTQLENFTGRKIAIDASMAMYQFLVAVRSAGPGGGGQAAMLMNDAGEVTSHIQGMFNRTIRIMTGGVRPVYVFDGKPPQMKGGELAKRLARRAKAENDLALAKQAEDVEDINKFSSRLVKVTRQHNEDCKELLRLMGVPVINAPCEAEAQCAELARKGKVYATATEDMDALTFRTPKLVRKLTFSQMKGKEKQMIMEIDFQLMLTGLDLTYEMFVDLCILCGCDYCSTIKGIGPKTALKLIKQYKCIEEVVKHLDKDKYEVPDDWLPQRILKKLLEEPEAEVEETEESLQALEAELGAEVKDEDEVKTEAVAEVAEVKTETKTDPGATDDSGLVDTPEKKTPEPEAAKEIKAEKKKLDMALEDTGNDEDYIIVPPLYAQARQLFLNCDVTDADEVDLKWEAPDEPKLIEFLVGRMGFSAERVASGIKRLKEAQVQKSQKRMDR